MASALAPPPRPLSGPRPPPTAGRPSPTPHSSTPSPLRRGSPPHLPPPHHASPGICCTHVPLLLHLLLTTWVQVYAPHMFSSSSTSSSSPRESRYMLHSAHMLPPPHHHMSPGMLHSAHMFPSYSSSSPRESGYAMHTARLWAFIFAFTLPKEDPKHVAVFALISVSYFTFYMQKLSWGLNAV